MWLAAEPSVPLTVASVPRVRILVDEVLMIPSVKVSMPVASNVTAVLKLIPVASVLLMVKSLTVWMLCVHLKIKPLMLMINHYNHVQSLSLVNCR